MIFYKHGISLDPEKVELIKNCKEPKDKVAMNSFLQTMQFSRIFLKQEDGQTYADLKKLLRAITSTGVRFKWTNECTKSFNDIKELLCSDKVMVAYDPTKKT